MENGKLFNAPIFNFQLINNFQLNKMKHFIHIFTFISLFTLSCCTPEEDPLAACKADPNCEYFTCLVDGEKWTPSCTPDPLFGCDPFDVQYYKETGFLEILVLNSNLGESFRIACKKSISNPTMFTINKFSTFVSDFNSQNCKVLKLDTTYQSSLVLNNIDTINFMVTGALNIKFSNSCPSTKLIENGNFNFRYRF
jgi:hypothetical protein